MKAEQVRNKVAEIRESNNLDDAIADAIFDAYQKGSSDAFAEQQKIIAEVYGKGGQPHDSERPRS